MSKTRLMSQVKIAQLKKDCAVMLRDCGYGSRPILHADKVEAAIFAFWRGVIASNNYKAPYIEICLEMGRYNELVTLQS